MADSHVNEERNGLFNTVLPGAGDGVGQPSQPFCVSSRKERCVTRHRTAARETREG